jgi:histidyl-tRNA synthetase
MCIIVGEEFTTKKQIVIKNMSSGEQSSVGVSDFFGRL